jgi:hypothetical protein
MSLEDLGNIGEFVAAVAVVVSLIYLAVQIRQNTGSLRTSAYEHVATGAADLNARISESAELTKLVTLGGLDPDRLSPEERVRFMFLMFAIFGNLEFIFQQWQRGLIEPDAWDRWSQTIRYYTWQPGVRSWWAIKPAPFSESFTRYVESECLGQPPNAEEMQATLAWVMGSEGRLPFQSNTDQDPVGQHGAPPAPDQAAEE